MKFFFEVIEKKRGGEREREEKNREKRVREKEESEGVLHNLGEGGSLQCIYT